MEFINNQIRDAEENFEYFAKKMIYSIIFYIIISILSIIICAFSNNPFINSILLIVFIYTLVKINYIYKYYIEIINDIRKTIKIDINLEIVNNILRYSK